MKANWDTLKLLDDTIEYLRSSAGEKDIFWTNELQNAQENLQEIASNLRKKLSREAEASR